MPRDERRDHVDELFFLSRANCMHSDAASQGGGWWQGFGAAYAQSYATELRWAMSGATARAAQMYSLTPSVLMLRSSSRAARSRVGDGWLAAARVKHAQL